MKQDDAISIVVADDESHIRNVVTLKLRNAGYDVRPAASGAEAVALVEACRPALLVTDFHMPGMTGVELCAAVKKIAPGLGAIMLTAQGHDLPDMDAAGAGGRGAAADEQAVQPPPARRRRGRGAGRGRRTGRPSRTRGQAGGVSRRRTA